MPSYEPSLRCSRKVFLKNKREVRVFKIRWSIVFTLLRTNKLSDQSKRNILKKRRRGNGSCALQVLELTKWQMFEIWSCWNNSWSTEQMSCYIGHMSIIIISKNWIKERTESSLNFIFRNQQLAKRVNLLQEEAEAAAKGKKGGRWRRETRWDKRTDYISYSIILGPGDIQHSIGRSGHTLDLLIVCSYLRDSSHDGKESYRPGNDSAEAVTIQL